MEKLNDNKEIKDKIDPNGNEDIMMNEDDESYLDDNGNENTKRDKRSYGNIKEDNEKAEEKLEKYKAPKRKFAIVHGYLGHKYCGNQK
jgi:hypothetical protein